MARAVGDRRVEAHALGKLVESAYIAGDMATAHQLAEQGVAIARELGDVQLLGEQLQGLASTAPTDGGRARIQERSRWHAAARLATTCSSPAS